MEGLVAGRPPEQVVQLPRPQSAASHLKHKELEVSGTDTPLSTLCCGRISQGSLYKRPGELDEEEEREDTEHGWQPGAGFGGQGSLLSRKSQHWANFPTCVGSVSKTEDKHPCLLLLAGL